MSVSGTSQEIAALAQAASGASVNDFRFVEPSAGDTQQGGLKLWAQFDGVSLARELRQAGLPYWGPERPDVLVWLAIDDHGRRYLASETGAQPVTPGFTLWRRP